MAEDTAKQPKFCIAMWALDRTTPTAVARCLEDTDDKNVERKYRLWANKEKIEPAFIDVLLRKFSDLFVDEVNRDWLIQSTPFEFFNALSVGAQQFVLKNLAASEENRNLFLRVLKWPIREPAEPQFKPDQVECLTSWDGHRGQEILHSARRSLHIVDSFVRGEFGSLTDRVSEAIKRNCRKPIEVRIDMLDPDWPFGG